MALILKHFSLPVDRWRSISTQLSAAGFRGVDARVRHATTTVPARSSAAFTQYGDVIHYAAVEGAVVSPDVLQRGGGGRFITPLGLQRLRLPPAQQIWGMDLTPGGVGCALSHIHLWGTIAARGLQRVLVLEDDSLLPTNHTFLSRFAERWRAVPSSWQLVYLSGLDTEQRAPLLQVADGVSLVPRMHRTTNCYVVNASGARALLDTVVPLTFQLDTAMTTQLSAPVSHLLSQHQGAGASAAAWHRLPASEEVVVGVAGCFTLWPPLVVQATRFGSDIQAQAQVSHDRKVVASRNSTNQQYVPLAMQAPTHVQ